jgi:hypothetical protein
MQHAHLADPERAARARRAPAARAARALVAALAALAACGEKDGDGGTACEDCAAGQVCVGNYDDNANTESERCEEAPAACDELSCEVDACRGALYDLCADGWIGVSCSPYEETLIVSCNPD